MDSQFDSARVSVDTVWQVIQELSQSPDMLTSNWCVPPEAGRLLYLLTRIQKAFCVVEVGTSIGFSTLHLALGVLENLQENNQQASQAFVTTIDASVNRQAMAKSNFERAGVSDLINIQNGSALDVLRQNADSWQGKIDLAFIDARKSEYLEYAQLLYQALKPGGLLVADNTCSHRKEMMAFVDFMLNTDRQTNRQWDSCEVDTPNGLMISRKR